MELPECCATCASLEKGKEDPHYGEKYISVYPAELVEEKTFFGGTRRYWKDLPVDHPKNITGGCQSFWESNRKHDPNRSYWQMCCRYYYPITKSEFLSKLNFRECMSAKEERLIRLKYDKERC